MFAIPAWIGVASRFLRRGSFYFLPPIRLNIPVNIHAGGSDRIIRIRNRILKPDEIYEIEAVYEDKNKIFGAELTLRDGEIIWLDRKQYWKLQGFLMQVGTEI